MATLATGVRWGTETPAIYFDVSYTASRSGANMVYTVNVDFQALSNNYGRYFGYPIYLDLSLDGVAKVTKTTVKNASPGNWSANQVYYHSSSFSIAKTTGTTALSLKIYSGDGSSRSQTYSYSLPVSPAASVLALPSSGFTIGSSGTTSITRYDSSFTDTVTYSVGSASGTITTISSGGSTTFNWTPATTLYAQMGGGTSTSGTITVTTKSGNTTVGTNTYTFALKGYAPSTLSLPSSFTVGTSGSVSITRHSSSFTDTVKYTLGSATGTITAISSGGSTSFNWTPPASLYLQMVGLSSKTGTMTVTTKSSSTTVGTKSYTFTLNAGSVYNTPKVKLTYQRGTGTGGSFTPSDSGTTLKITATINVYGGQTATYTLKLDGTTKETASSVSSGTRITYIENVSSQTSHKVLATLTDSLGSSTSFTLTVSTEAVPMNINVDYPGIAFGKLSEQNAFECALKIVPYANIIFDDQKQTTERYIRFANVAGSTYEHNCTLYGGDPTTATAIGLWDTKNQVSILAYRDTTQTLSLRGDGTLSVTRSDNTYVSSSGFSNFAAYRRSNLYIIRGYIEVTTSMPNNTNWTEIGQISDYSALYAEYLTVACGNGTGAIRVRITTGGVISIANVSGVAVSGYCHFSSAVVCN